MAYRGRPLGYPGRRENLDFNQESDMDDLATNRETETSSASQQQGQQANYASGYTVVSPDEKKRRKLLEQAERERQMYENHRKQNTPHHLSYVGAVGHGYGLTQREAREQQVRTHAQHNKTSRRLKDEERRQKQREEEEKVLEEKKMAARKQAEKNAQRQEERREQWKDDMRRTNQAFLDKLEAQSKMTSSSTSTTATTPSSVHPPVRQQASSTSSTLAGRLQENPPLRFPASQRKEAPSPSLAFQRNFPLNRGDERKSIKAEHQASETSFVPTVKKEPMSSDASQQSRFTDSSRFSRSGPMLTKTAGSQKSRGSETTKEAASSKTSGELGSLRSSGIKSGRSPPRGRSSRMEDTALESSRFRNDASQPFANYPVALSLGRRTSGGRTSDSSSLRGTTDAMDFSRSFSSAMQFSRPSGTGSVHRNFNYPQFSASAQGNRAESDATTQDTASSGEAGDDGHDEHEDGSFPEDAEVRLPSASSPDASENLWQNLQMLQERFPHFDQSILWDVLQQCHGSLELALQLLAP